MGIYFDKQYTYVDYLTWNDGIRRELLNGFVRLFAPDPSSVHASISSEIHDRCFAYIKQNKGKCKVLTAPFDVCLPNGSLVEAQITTVVQPDICIICDLSKITPKACMGVPDMVVEILSLSTQKYDWNDKFNLYEASGVTEYWVVDPFTRSVHVFLNKERKFDKGTIYTGHQTIPVRTLQGLTIVTNDLFE